MFHYSCLFRNQRGEGAKNINFTSFSSFFCNLMCVSSPMRPPMRPAYIVPDISCRGRSSGDWTVRTASHLTSSHSNFINFHLEIRVLKNKSYTSSIGLIVFILNGNGSSGHDSQGWSKLGSLNSSRSIIFFCLNPNSMLFTPSSKKVPMFAQ